MGYKHIPNLYKSQIIMMFKECYAMEKIHGTSAHIAFNRVEDSKFLEEKRSREVVFGGQQIILSLEEIAELKSKFPDKMKITYFSGGANYAQFIQIFDDTKLKNKLLELGYKSGIIYGEAYGGNLQGMSKTYGPTLKFVAFEVFLGDKWCNVEYADIVCKQLDLEFVHYVKIPCTIEAINAERDADSVQAIRNGMGTGHIREGVVLRPLMEFVHQGDHGGVIRVKHKRDEFKETNTKREVVEDPNYLKILQDAEQIADEWVTEQRLAHVIDKLEVKDDLGVIIKAMLEDITREAEGEIILSKEARNAMSKKTVKIFKEVQNKILENYN